MWICYLSQALWICYLFQGFVDFVTYSKALWILLPVPRFCGFCYLFQGLVDFVTYSKACGFVTYSKVLWILLPIPRLCGFCYLFQGFVDLLPIPRLVDFVTYSKALWILLPIPRCGFTIPSRGCDSIYCLSSEVVVFALLRRLIVWSHSGEVRCGGGVCLSVCNPTRSLGTETKAWPRPERVGTTCYH